MANKFTKTGKYISCRTCSKSIYLMPYEVKSGRKKYCSKGCLYKGDSYTKLFEKGHKDLVPKEKRGHTEETRIKISVSSKGKHSGPLAWNWKHDRSMVKVGDRHLNDPLQKGWRKAVKDRDGWKCRIGNSDCLGRLEAHHILRYSEYPELRNDINNGITLCQAHHPRKKSEEKRLEPLFMELVSVSKVSNR